MITLLKDRIEQLEEQLKESEQKREAFVFFMMDIIIDEIAEIVYRDRKRGEAAVKRERERREASRERNDAAMTSERERTDRANQMMDRERTISVQITN